MILVINGSPTPKGNLCRMLEKIAEDTEEDYEFVNLAEMRIGPCRGCAKCASTNRCIQQDDMGLLYEMIVKADALLLGAVVYFGQANAFTHTFIERMYALRHRLPLTRNKPAAVVCVGAEEADSPISGLTYRLKRFFNYNVVGSVTFNSFTPPCFICGFGTTCRYGRPTRWMTAVEFENFDEITPEVFRRFEDDPEVVSECERLSHKLKVEMDFVRP